MTELNNIRIGRRVIWSTSAYVEMIAKKSRKQGPAWTDSRMKSGMLLAPMVLRPIFLVVAISWAPPPCNLLPYQDHTWTIAKPLEIN